MKIFFLTFSLIVATTVLIGQPGKKTVAKDKAPVQSEMDKTMEDAMKGMSEEEKTEMRKMMKNVMPGMEEKPVSDIASFTNNKTLIPPKDVARINSISKKIFSDADVIANTALLYNKLMAKIPSSEKTILTSVLAKAKNASSLMEAAITSLLQGHNQVAIGLALKALQSEPKNVNHQNNLAAILSQSGYPEKAIPYLKKLSNQFPANSTVMHNLGYAWFSLGQTDTARKLFGYAVVRNPNNPETKLCRGVIAELSGDEKKAADNYVESFEQAPNPFTENMTKNVKAEDRLEKIDFEKLKSRIVIYEYFKKDWIKIPALTDNVSAFEKNMSIKNGYSKMFDELTGKIEEMAEASATELNALADKGITDFVETMMKENIKGLSMMSMPSVYVQKILQNHMNKWNEDYGNEHNKLLATIEAKKKVITKSVSNDKCPDYDRKNNEFIAYANPLLRNFHAKKIEECRVWVNAFCTWSWYITGNIKNSVITQSIGWTGFFADMYKQAIEDQHAIAMSCVKQDGDGATYIPVPVIPDFTCPAVVSIPIGLDELRLNAETVNFDDNNWNIKKAEGSTTPNVTLSQGVDKNDITEPGKYGNPYIKTSNGSINISGINYAEIDDEELTPLSKIMDDLTPLSKITTEDLTPLDPALLDLEKKLSFIDLKKLRNAEMTRKLLKEMMKTKCPGELPVKKTRKTSFWMELGNPVEVPELEVSFGEAVEQLSGDKDIWDDEVKGWMNSKGDYQFKDKDFTMTLRTSEIKEIEVNGLQTAISNGLEAIGTIKNFIKGLFD